MAKIETLFEYFIYYGFMPILWLIGLFGNTIGLIVLNRMKINVKNIYQYLFTSDSISLILLSNTYLIEGFNLNLIAYSSVICKAYTYLSYVVGSLSPMLLVYILIERYLSIRYPVESNLLRKHTIQLSYLIFIIVANLIYNILAPFYYDITLENGSNSTQITCNIVNSQHKRTLSYFLFINRIFLPFGLMIVISILLIVKISKSHSQISTFYSKREEVIFKKDVHLSVISILMCLVFICLNLPVIVVFFYIPMYTDNLFYFTWYIFLFGYAINFYLFLFTKASFRKSFLSIFKFSKSDYKSNIRLEIIHQFN